VQPLVAEMAQRLPTNSIRFVSDPAMPVMTIAQIAHSITGLIEALDGCDVAIAPRSANGTASNTSAMRWR
jgi:hypothetical protein